MSFNGSGTFQINTAGQPVVSGTVISSTAFNALTADLATGLSTCITKDGQTTVTANIPMGNNKITGLANATLATDAANLGQVQGTTVKLISPVSGADTITGSMTPALTAYAGGQMFYFIAVGDNTGPVTLNIDSLGAKAVTRDGSVALAASDIKSGEVVVVVYDGTRFQVVSQLNSSGDARFANVSIASTLYVGGVATFTSGTAAAPAITTAGDTNTGIFFPAADTIAFAEGGVEALRIDSSANVGIGTSSPAYKLDVAGTGGTAARIRSSSAYSGLLLSSQDSNAATRNWLVASNWNAYGDLAIVQSNAQNGDPITAGTTRLAIDPSGNLGLGVTPSAWGTAKAIDVLTDGGAFFSFTRNAGLASNSFWNGANWLYKSTGFATRYESSSGATGTHAWLIAPSGTAGNAISFTQAMTLDASGNLFVGATGQAFAEKFRMYGNYAVFDNASYTGFIGQGSALGTATASDFAIRSSNALAFLTNGANERARITAAGNFKVNGTADRGTTEGTGQVVVFNGTAPVGTLTNGVSFYAQNGLPRMMDATGEAFTVGYRNIPASGTKTGSYTLQTTDVGKYVQIGTGGSITIPDATFAEGDIVSLFNNTTGNITITCTITTAYIGGIDSDKATVTLATRGVATIFFISGTVCVINGNVS